MRRRPNPASRLPLVFLEGYNMERLGHRAVDGGTPDVFSYQLPTMSESLEEADRLNEQHACFRMYLGDTKLSYAPLEQLEPRRILELGCGTGIWATEAAKMFPDAQVVAVDSAAMSEQALLQLPGNVSFHQASILDYLNSKPPLSDVVHARMVLMHNPNPEALIDEMAATVKPGGYLLIEDPDFSSLIATGGPSMVRLMAKWTQMWRDKGCDVQIGKREADLLRSTGAFAQVGSTRIPMPLGGDSSSADPALNRLGASFAVPVRNAALTLVRKWQEPGLAEETVRDMDMGGATMDFYFAWARRVD
ncbi:unnamed protein product [Mycena citricolor]|uniref:S-adenosyl-L-methionine-dependent methyltransferase n=1 Tax=Mycena citricolor TaxID=2018698 RepID=A0AAD2HKL3_9AGAR|nr:unnamed protein product [Mycena citricolor]